MIAMQSERRLSARGRARGYFGACVVALAFVLAGCSFLSPPGIVVVLSDGSSAYMEVARELVREYGGNVEIYRRDDPGLRLSELQQRVQRSGKTIVVAVGLPAAQLTAHLVNKRIIFCQVFNYEDARLLALGMRGVSTTPPVAEQFRNWKLLSPQLKNVGVVTGPGLSTLLDEANAAARLHNITLTHVVTNTDKEMLFAYKRMTPKVQGFWLLPDNRILSSDSVRDLLAFSAKQGKQTLVFTPELLGSGALLSAENDPADVAARVLDIVRGTEPADNAPVAVVPLTRARIRINSLMAKLLNLPLPPEIKGLAYVP